MDVNEDEALVLTVGHPESSARYIIARNVPEVLCDLHSKLVDFLLELLEEIELVNFSLTSCWRDELYAIFNFKGPIIRRNEQVRRVWLAGRFISDDAIDSYCKNEGI